MVFQKMPRSPIQHLYLGRLFASDRRTDGQTDGRCANFLERYVFDNHPFGVDNILIAHCSISRAGTGTKNMLAVQTFPGES